MAEVKEPKTHIFLKSCGCLSCAIVDVPEMYKELAKAFRYAANHNETYKLVPTQQVRDMDWKCAEHKTKKSIPVAKQVSLFEDKNNV
jgi:hypothetical protein